MKTNLYFVLICSILLLNCSQEPTIDEDLGNNSRTGQRVQARTGTQPLILGKQLENPFSIANMQKAMTELLSQSDETLQEAGVQKKSVQSVILDITDLYVRMKATDSLSALSLQNDTTLTLFAFPLDYEIKQRGDYYEDPTIKEGEYPWFYTTVKPGYVPQQKVQMEVLSELFIPEHSDLYIVEDIDQPTEVANTASTQKPFTQNMVNALLCKAFEITGNSHQLATTEEETQSIKPKVTYQNCTRYRFLWARWTSCDTWYNPSGYIKVQTPSGEQPVKGIQVRMWRWFYYGDARTNSNGYFIHTGRWNKLLIGNDMDYHILFNGVNGNNGWTIQKSIAGAFCVWEDWYDAGYHSPSEFNITFYTNSYYWGKCVLHNAIYDYMNYARRDGLSLPPSYLQVANKESNDFTSAAPLFSNHLNIGLIYGLGIGLGSIATVLGYGLLGWGLPDLILRYNSDLSRYNEMTAIVWHELTHASHFQRLKSENFSFATYWSSYAGQVIKNELSTGNSYGNKGDANWQIIALAEGWANYREWKLAIEILRWNSFSEKNWTNVLYRPSDDIYKTRFPEHVGGMFDELQQVGCSYRYMEQSLVCYSFGEFREKLSSIYPWWKDQITNIVNKYESKSYK